MQTSVVSPTTVQEDAQPAGVPELQLQLHGDPGRPHLLLQRLQGLHRRDGLPASPSGERQRQGEREVQAERAFTQGTAQFCLVLKQRLAIIIHVVPFRKTPTGIKKLT